ncbi:MAG: acylphosphatase [Gammaproteobacteria bacterium]
MDETLICKHGHIAGLVQGVFFRLETQKQAQRLGLTGWVRNTDDGRVEVMICGTEHVVAEMVTWLHQGPPRAKVNSVDLAEVEDGNFDDFLIVG